MKKFSFLFLVGVIILINACGDPVDPTAINTYATNADCSKVPAINTYSTTIKPLLTVSCALSGCHDTKTAAKKIILDTYAGAKAAFLGNAKGLCSIYQDGCSDKMPQGSSKLSADVLNMYACWVKNNTPE